MGNYVFDADALMESVTRDSTMQGSKHDMGGDIVPAFVRRNEAGVYDFKDNEVPGATDRDRGYWRDVGTMRSYYEAHVDIVVAAADLQPLQLRVADLHQLRPAAPGEARQGRRRQPPAGRGVAALAGCRDLRWPGTPVGAVAGGPGRAGRGRRGLGA